MKDRNFWEGRIDRANALIQGCNVCMARFKNTLKKASRKKSRNRLDEHQIESSIAALKRRELFWMKRIEYYKGRIKALQRTRYQRILRTPVIEWPSAKSVQYPTVKRSA